MQKPKILIYESALHFSVQEKLVAGIKGPRNRLNGNMKREEFWVEEKEEKVVILYPTQNKHVI